MANIPKVLTDDQRLALDLVARSKAPWGEWSKVSKTYMPHIKKIPCELCTVEETEDGAGRARLTTAGIIIVTYT